jgi:hypothetical protein
MTIFMDFIREPPSHRGFDAKWCIYLIFFASVKKSRAMTSKAGWDSDDTFMEKRPAVIQKKRQRCTPRLKSAEDLRKVSGLWMRLRMRSLVRASKPDSDAPFGENWLYRFVRRWNLSW